MKHINKYNLVDYAFLNEDTLVKPAKAVCINLHGFSDDTVYDKSPEKARILGERGIAWAFPYYSVWGWANDRSLKYVEQVIDAVYDKLELPDDIPFIVCGGSMGGLTALNYLVRGKRKAIGCALNCAVVDLNKIFEDIPVFRRAVFQAHIDEEDELCEVMKRYSPVNFADKLPRIPYFFVYGEKDVYFTNLLRPLIEDKFNEQGIEYTMLVQKGMEHCDLKSHPDALGRYCDFIVSLVDA